MNWGLEVKKFMVWIIGKVESEKVYGLEFMVWIIGKEESGK
ncbi:MAG TPA: hypothetical protein VFD29_04645 [Gillisia sp.]|nr:hypothetical protein [Gillisia sp.]